MINTKITILHPFSPKAGGVLEKKVSTYHSQPHVKALRSLAKNKGFNCSIKYLTHKIFSYSYEIDFVKWQFYPVTFQLNSNHKKWKKQMSNSCVRDFKKNTPDLTIFNFSGHNNLLSNKLAEIIRSKNKYYVAMLGGQHFTDVDSNRDFYKGANHILVHTELQKNTMQSMELFENKDIRVFPLGVDCSKFEPNPNKETSKTAPKLLYVGKIVEWKQVHLAVESLKALVNFGFKETKLTLIGPVVSHKYYRSILDIIKYEKLESNFEYLGQIEYENLPQYYREADLFLLPSYKETFGMVMVEAMACGVPVAAMDCIGGPAEVITNLEDGILSNKNNYVNDVVNLFTDDKKISDMSNKARATILKKYSLEATFKALETTIKLTLGND